MSKSSLRTMQPSDYQVNKTWLAYRINTTPLQVEGQAIDLYVLQDAASMFLFGNAFAPSGTAYPPAEEVEQLMVSARDKKNKWPSELVLLGNPVPENTFAAVARRHGIAVRFVPGSQMSLYITDTQKAYQEFLFPDASDA